MLLRDSILWRERRVELLAEAADEDAAVQQDLLDESAELREAARRLLLRLEKSGWFQFEYRSEQGWSFTSSPTRRGSWKRSCGLRATSSLFSGLCAFHRVAASTREFHASSGVALLEAKRHTLDLTRELKILSQNIHGFIQRLFLAASTAHHVLAEASITTRARCWRTTTGSRP